MGLFGWALPEQYGGLGLNAEQDALLAMELGYTTPSFRSLFGTNNGIAGQVLVNYGTDDQKSEWLPRLASGEVVASFALTESEAGSDPSGLRTKAVRDGDDYIINGSKRFITNAEASDVLIVFARTDPNATGSKGISVFLVPTKSEGVTVGPHDHKMGQAGAWTSEIFFDDVRVPAANLIGGEEEKGFYAAMASLNKGRLHIAAICVGQSIRILDESVRFAADAKQGEPIARFQLVQAMLADIYTEVPPPRRSSSPPRSAGMQRPIASSAPPRRSSSPPKHWLASPTRACRSKAEWAICASQRSNGSTVTPASSASTKAPPRSSASSSPSSCSRARTSPSSTSEAGGSVLHA